MDKEIFQGIYEKLSPVLPQDWKTVIFRADYTESSYSMKFYIDSGNGTYVDCYNLTNTSKTVLIKVFMAVDGIISAERRKLQEKDRWSVMTVIVSSDGKFKSDFDYRDISENMISYQDEWEKKYLAPPVS